MTLDEFLELLRFTPDGWHLEYGELRDDCDRCPILAVYDVMYPDKPLEGNGEFEEAAEALRLDQDQASRIVYAADTKPAGDIAREMRTRLLAAVGLTDG